MRVMWLCPGLQGIMIAEAHFFNLNIVIIKYNNVNSL
jgi:hypothetical protein